MLKLLTNIKHYSLYNRRCCSTIKENETKSQTTSNTFETVFSFPFIRYIALLNRLKVYQIAATSLAVPGCGLMEVLNVLPEGALMIATYIGITGTTLLSLASVPFRNTVGYLYISTDNQKIKISSVDFWGKRKDKIVTTDEWFPLLDMTPKATDVFYLQPHLADGTKYKLFVKFGKVINPIKVGQVLE